MILRVPDYYDEFHCIASNCRDCCCRGWEIDVDEETRDYYMTVEDSPFGDKLKSCLGEAEDGTPIFKLNEKGRCPFLSSANLCEICIKMGEESLSEICTEYPRFAIEYGNVLQKCLSLACEEVGRILFTKQDKISIIDYEDKYVGNDLEEDETEKERIKFLENVQNNLIEIFEDDSLTLEDRNIKALAYGKFTQDRFNMENYQIVDLRDKEFIEFVSSDSEISELKNIKTDGEQEFLAYKYRFALFDGLETINEKWIDFKKILNEKYSDANVYNNLIENFKNSESYNVFDFEKLSVYFVFRYFMNSVYDNNILSKVKSAIYCPRFILDMDACVFECNDQIYSNVDRIETVKMFSKEVEHSEENVEIIEDEMNFTKIEDILM
ncbi:flagellin lysine-N-methylase [Lachnobacterium bovis]|uniref:flagellin lysine-N-methylase n=1 Tax=Lachnobacterium bovis TaxID=140626 RepID=UPI0003B433C0|nr:flagellin lysine-N-methylase [Lachnobacterium bovis]